MDTQQLFNIAVSIAGFFGGWTLNNIYRAIERLDADARTLPHTYVAKEDYRGDIAEVKNILHQIFDKLDGKADK